MAKEIYSIAGLAKILNWSQNKTSVYYGRGKFEAPEYMAGKRPFWSEEQVRRINKARM